MRVRLLNHIIIEKDYYSLLENNVTTRIGYSGSFSLYKYKFHHTLYIKEKRSFYE